MKLITLTNMDDTPLWINRDSIDSIRPTNPSESYKRGGSAVFVSGQLHLVRESPQQIMGMIDEKPAAT